MKKSWKTVLRIIGILAFGYIIFHFDFGSFFHLLKDANILFFVLGSCFLIPSIILKSLRWHLMLKRQNIVLSFFVSLIVYCEAIYIGTLTPGRIGELFKIRQLRKKGHPITGALISTFLDRFFDLTFLLLVGYFGMLFLFSIFANTWIWLSIIFVCFIVFICLIYLFRKRLEEFFLRVLGRLLPDKISVTHRLVVSLKSAIRRFKFVDWTLYSLVTGFAWLMYFFMLYLVSLSLGLKIGFLFCIMIVSIAALVSLIPISVSGIGTRDAILLLILLPLGYPYELIIAFSLGILFMSLLGTFLGFLCYLYNSTSN